MQMFQAQHVQMAADAEVPMFRSERRLRNGVGKTGDDEQLAAGVQVEPRPVRRVPPPPPARAPLRCMAPNSVFAFGRSFAR